MYCMYVKQGLEEFEKLLEEAGLTPAAVPEVSAVTATGSGSGSNSSATEPTAEEQQKQAKKKSSKKKKAPAQAAAVEKTGVLHLT